MAKFCTKCGKPLKDGKPCDCSVKEEKVVKETAENTNELISNVSDIYKIFENNAILSCLIKFSYSSH